MPQFHIFNSGYIQEDMKYFVFYILLLHALSQDQSLKHNHTIYHLIPDYATYHKLFQQNAGANNTIEMTQYGTGAELCEGMRACRFYIYLSQPEDVTKVKYNILMTSGIHGNQLLGPTSLLYLYPLMKAEDVRIIYFPVLNPSGYDRKSRLTYPNGLDLNRDYPIDLNTKCYRGSATRILDKIFRQYKIDITLTLHNGGDQISWNWGTKYNQKFPKTDDYPIYSSIGTMLQFFGGFNQRLGIRSFDIGTMDQVVYPAEGTLDDWAYAGSWSQSSVPKCDNYMFEPYPKEMHQGLVFLFELGIHNAPENMLGTSEGLNQPSDSNKNSNGYVTRTIRMLRELQKVVSPILNFQWAEQKLLMRLQGCNTISSLSLEVRRSSDNETQWQQITIEVEKILKINSTFTHLAEITVADQNSLKSEDIYIKYKYECNKQWVGKGRSFLAKERLFEGILILQNITAPTEQAKNFAMVNGREVEKHKIYWGLVIIPLFLFGLFIYRLFLQRKPIKPVTNKKIKEVQVLETNENINYEGEYAEVEMESSETDRS